MERKDLVIGMVPAVALGEPLAAVILEWRKYDNGPLDHANGDVIHAQSQLNCVEALPQSAKSTEVHDSAVAPCAAEVMRIYGDSTKNVGNFAVNSNGKLFHTTEITDTLRVPTSVIVSDYKDHLAAKQHQAATVSSAEMPTVIHQVESLEIGTGILVVLGLAAYGINRFRKNHRNKHPKAPKPDTPAENRPSTSESTEEHFAMQS